MTRHFKLTLMSGVAVAAVMAAGTANATNGYFSNGYGTASKGMSGAGAAMSLDTQATMLNPAGMYALGNRLDVGIALFSPRRSVTIERGTGTGAGFFDANAGGKTKSDSEWFAIPSFGVNFDYGDYSLGLTVSANGGMNTDYKKTIFNGGTSGKTGIDLAQMFVGATYARKVNDSNTFGITPTFAVQRFKAVGLQGFAGISNDAGRLTDRGYSYSYGYGVRLGWMTELSDAVTVGASYQTRTYMTKFSKYAGLFAEGGDFDVPPVVTLGTAVKATDKLTVALDYKRIFYGSVKAIANSHNANAQANQFKLGGNTGSGFGWDDVDVFKLGAEYDVDDALTVRGGASYSTAPFEDTETMFNILAPATVQVELSMGATYKINAAHEVGIAVTRAFGNDITGDGNVNHSTNTVKLDMDQYDVDVGYTYNF